MSDRPFLQHDVSLRTRNTFGVEARARVLVEIEDHADLPRLFADPTVAALPRLILGGGSNILFTRDFDGLVLQPALHGKTIVADDGDEVRLRVGAGENWDRLVRWSLRQGLCGLENLALIPGLVGAAPIQNIGAYGVEFAALCSAVEIHDIGQAGRRVLRAEECTFGYRHSIFKTAIASDWIVTAVELRLRRRAALQLDYAGLREQLQASGVVEPGASDVADAVTALRRRKLPDPAVLGNAGSFFQNPIVATTMAEALQERYPGLPAWPADAGRRKLSAAWLIEQCGCKGLRDGDAGVSAQHALVLVNHGHASGAQLWALAQQVQRRVHAQFGVQLQAEPRVI